MARVIALIVFSLLPLQLLNSFRNLVSSCPPPRYRKPCDEAQIADQIEEMVALFFLLYFVGELV